MHVHVLVLGLQVIGDILTHVNLQLATLYTKKQFPCIYIDSPQYMTSHMTVPTSLYVSEAHGKKYIGLHKEGQRSKIVHVYSHMYVYIILPYCMVHIVEILLLMYHYL